MSTGTIHNNPSTDKFTFNFLSITFPTQFKQCTSDNLSTDAAGIFAKRTTQLTYFPFRANSNQFEYCEVSEKDSTTKPLSKSEGRGLFVAQQSYWQTLSVLVTGRLHLAVDEPGRWLASEVKPGMNSRSFSRREFGIQAAGFSDSILRKEIAFLHFFRS